MDVKSKITRLTAQYILGLIFAVGAAISLFSLILLLAVLAFVFPFVLITMEIGVILMVFIAFPLGGCFGISFADKIMGKTESHNKLKIGVGWLLGVLCILFFEAYLPLVYGVDPLRSESIKLFGWKVGVGVDLLIIVLFNLIGYYLVEFFQRSRL